MTSQLIKLDLVGVECPDFNLSLRAFFRKATPGVRVLIQSTAHNAVRDVNALCDFGGHKLVAQRSINEMIEFIVERGE